MTEVDFAGGCGKNDEWILLAKVDINDGCKFY